MMIDRCANCKQMYHPFENEKRCYKCGCSGRIQEEMPVLNITDEEGEEFSKHVYHEIKMFEHFITCESCQIVIVAIPEKKFK